MPTYVASSLTDYRHQVELSHAEVAKLADALRSGRSGLTLMRVQIPPSALLPGSGIAAPVTGLLRVPGQPFLRRSGGRE